MKAAQRLVASEAAGQQAPIQPLTTEEKAELLLAATDAVQEEIIQVRWGLRHILARYAS